ncbi:proliferating-cell nucleolar protein-like (ISS) [Dorcoceras hygrometricum]|uniref:Proliferating-cell nucleolar protein-like (ISS) n=1 Tax=Dorcoceras hygrometricum TaxID=472368 RepID=A0A2Z7A883_9LAMI|nr:proliferating-cell nucleolar protein-like (ISS) [Dorcoceras hygrometricum]
MLPFYLTANRSSNLSKQLANQLITKLNQLTTYGRELRPASTTRLKTNQLKSESKPLNKAYTEAQTDWENCRPDIHDDIELCDYFVFPQQADPKLQTSINQKILKRRAQRHQACSKQWRKS